MDTAKDVTRGVIDGFVEGASAADIFRDSLKKIADSLLNDVLNSMFQVKNFSGASGGGGFLSSLFGGGGGGGGFLSSILSMFGGSGVPMYAKGTSSARPGMALVGEEGPELVRFGGGEEVVPNHRMGAALGGMPSIQAPTIPKLSPQQPQASATIAPVYNIDARGADSAAIARLQAQLDRQNREFAANTMKVLKQAGPRGIHI